MPDQASPHPNVIVILYDLQADPYELNNLAGSKPHRFVADVLSERLRRRMVDAGEPVPTIQPPAPERAGGYTLKPDEAGM